MPTTCSIAPRIARWRCMPPGARSPPPTVAHSSTEQAGRSPRRSGTAASTWWRRWWLRPAQSSTCTRRSSRPKPCRDSRARVAEVVPVADARVFPVSGGSEANESAIKLARAYHLARGEDRHVVLARHGSYHGNSRGALDASAPRVGDGRLRTVARPDRARPARQPVPRRAHRRRARRRDRPGDPRHRAERVAAFIAEPVSGATLGAVVPPDDYWPEVADVLRGATVCC